MNSGLTDPPPIVVRWGNSDVAEHVVPHGTMSAYKRHSCRCVHCTLANTVYERERRGLKARVEGYEVPHGTRSRYVGWRSRNTSRAGCRCDECTVANREYQRVYMRLWRQGITLKADWEEWS